MTAAALTQVPFAAGSALLGATGRAALWGLAQYSRAPLSNTAILALAVFSLMAGSNALYLQAHPHPAPLFGEPSAEATPPRPMPVIPAVRKGKPVVPNIELPTTTGSVTNTPAAAEAPRPIGNAEVFDIQRKLEALGYFDAALDGYYGPKTARAIKRFEQANGMRVKGELTHEIVAAIMAAPLAPAQPLPAPLAASDSAGGPEPVATGPAPPDLATETIALVPAAPAPEPGETAAAPQQALAAPRPLEPALTTATAVQWRALPSTPQEAMNIAIAVASKAVDAALDVVQGNVQLGPAQPLPPRPGPVAGSPAVAPEPQPEAVPASSEDGPEAAGAADPRLVAKVQQGLANLGFLRGEIDGVAGEATAKAIRNFEVYFNYTVTGRVSPGLVDLLTDAGAYI